MDRLLADETILRILAYLDAADLVRLQAVNSHLRALAKDRHLWKRLFFLTFIRPTLHPGGQSQQPADAGAGPVLPTLREIRSLLLHQHLPIGKAVRGDGLNRIHRIPDRFYTSRPSSPATPSAHDDERSLHAILRLDDDERISEQHLDWEQLYRVSNNWQGGNFAVSELRSVQVGRLPTTPAKAQVHQPQPRGAPTIVRVSSSYIFTAAPFSDDRQASGPEVLVYPCDMAAPGSPQNAIAADPRPGDLRDRTPIARFSSPSLRRLIAQRHSSTMNLDRVHITEIAVDAAPLGDAQDSLRPGPRKRKDPESANTGASVTMVVVAYASGHVGLFSLHRRMHGGGSQLEVEERAFLDTRTFSPGTHVAMAALHSPALVLCSSRFDISFARIATSAAGTLALELVQRLSSFRCSWPASLRLKPLPFHGDSKRPRRASRSRSSGRVDEADDQAAFRVTLAYSSPSYPSSWSVSVQELVVRFHTARSDPAPQVGSRHATARHPFRSTPIDLRGRSMLSGPRQSSCALADAEPRVGDGGSRTTSLTYDDPFVVVGASDNMLDVYELLGACTHVRRDTAHAPRSATATPVGGGEALQLAHRRTLYGHTGSVHSVALEDGRCVSGGADGSVMVWSLGDRANDTDSIASFLRNDRLHGQATPAPLQDDAEAATMTHVLTLRSPVELEDSQSAGRQHAGLSLSQIVRSRLLDRHATRVVRSVATAFDKIVSVIAYTDAPRACRADAVEDTQHARERIQVWSFA